MMGQASGSVASKTAVLSWCCDVRHYRCEPGRSMDGIAADERGDERCSVAHGFRPLRRAYRAFWRLVVQSQSTIQSRWRLGRTGSLENATKIELEVTDQAVQVAHACPVQAPSSEGWKGGWKEGSGIKTARPPRCFLHPSTPVRWLQMQEPWRGNLHSRAESCIRLV
jgi:hypothetical protein